MNYCVVKFITTNSLAVVSNAWLLTLDDIKYCYWPSQNVNISQLVKKHAEPDAQHWNLFTVKILIETGKPIKLFNYYKFLQ
jgi:uncharacterized membrane protein YwzB